jgi:hypothetical protein
VDRGAALVAPASLRDDAGRAVAGKVAIFGDRVEFAAARGGAQVSLPVQDIVEAELAPTPLISATRAWLRSRDGDETLLSITAPIRTVATALAPSDHASGDRDE